MRRRSGPGWHEASPSSSSGVHGSSLGEPPASANPPVMRKLLIVLFASLVAAPIAAPVQARVADNPWLERRVLNIAHQGGEIEAPSNTLFALKTAKEKGADVLEIDVHATADRELVVLHDDTVDRTTNGTGRVDGMTLEQIKQLDAAHWFV